MILTVVGVLFDGSRQRPGVPLNPRRTLRMTKRTDTTVRCTLLRANGSPLLVPAGAAVTLVVKRKPTDGTPTISSTGAVNTLVGANVVDFAIPSSATKTVLAGRYGYDILYTDASGNRNSIVPLSPFVLEDSPQA